MLAGVDAGAFLRVGALLPLAVFAVVVFAALLGAAVFFGLGCAFTHRMMPRARLPAHGFLIRAAGSRPAVRRATVSHPMKRALATFDHRTLDELAIEDESSFRHVALYSDLKEVLRRSGFKFRVLPVESRGRADRALLLNLSFWAAEAGGDVLADGSIAADVVAHAAWHHLAARELASESSGAMSVEALFLGEAVASAFDVYLVGRLLGHAPRSTFLRTQVPAMAETAQAAGLSRASFARLLAGFSRAPDRAFEDLRELLFDAATALFACRTPEQGHAALRAFDRHRYAALLHRFELSNWVLYARAWGREGRDAHARAVDRALRRAKAPLGWLGARWVAPALAAATSIKTAR